MGIQFLIVILALALGGCASHTVSSPTTTPGVDAVVIPGCPTLANGALSRCLKRRVRWGAWLYDAGLTRYFIVSGSNVYSRHLESDALAAGLASLGVPAQAIVVEPNALHTDENMYYAHLLAEAMGLARLAVATDLPQAIPGCTILRSVGRETCVVFAINPHEIEGDDADARLDAIRIRPEPEETWRTRRQREIERAQAAGRARRPPSWWLYSFRALSFKPWMPIPPPHTTVLTWAERSSAALMDQKSPDSLPALAPDVQPHPHR